MLRISPRGMEFALSVISDTQTEVRLIKSQKSMIFDMSPEELSQCWYFWNRGDCIQSAFKNLPAEQREFLITGLTPSEWNSIFGED